MKEEVFTGPVWKYASGIFRAVTGTMPGSVAHSPIPVLTEAENLVGNLEHLRRLVEYPTVLAATRVARKSWACCVVLGCPSSRHAGGGLG